jgi:hypothetical protein
MAEIISNGFTSFDGHQRIASGSLYEVVLITRQVIEQGAVGSVLIFDDSMGRLVDVDMRGSAEEILRRLSPPDSSGGSVEQVGDGGTSADKSRDRGRPKLGVVAREVTLLPRHWEWLAAQPGGASATLRRLVDEARRTNTNKEKRRNAQDRAYRFMSAIAGDMPGFEEASRALFADDQARFVRFTAEWPQDVRDYAIHLAFADDDSTPSKKTDLP